MNQPSNPVEDPRPSRRVFLKAGAVAGAAVAVGAAAAASRSQAEEENAGKLKITIAGYDYDRVEGLMDGSVKVDRCAARFESSRIGDMNRHVFSGPQSRQVSEIGLLPFILAFANDEFRDYTLIPVFPLRVFRHKSIFVGTDRGIKKPQDLRGRKVATVGYSSTSLTWIRGILQHEYGVKPEEIDWIISGGDSSAKASGGASKFEKVIPQGLSIEKGPKEKDESDLLLDGTVDAILHAAEPRAFQQGDSRIARLFPDSRQTEQAYFKKTGIFPIMHAVALRRDVVEANSWLPEAVFNAYSQAKQQTYDFLRNSAWYKTSLPWVAQEAEQTRQLMGDNFWPYGITPNRKALDALLQYAHEQGLARRRVTIEELFSASTMDLAEKS